MTVIVFIVLIGVLLINAYYNRKVYLKRIEQIELQNEQQAEVVEKLTEEIKRGVILFHKGTFIVYREDAEGEAEDGRKES